MNTSIYAAPKADLTMPVEVAGDGFYVVSRRKFLVMYFMTLGFYKIYWFYKNWSMYKTMERAEGGADSNIWPVPRAIFSVFFVHALMREAYAHASGKLRNVNPDFDTTATALVGLMLVSNVIDRLSWKGVGSPFTDYAGLALLLPLAYFLNIARQFINDASGDSTGKSNDSFTWANWIWIVIGALFWIVVAIGVFAIATGMNVE
jgi:hypothetical protein